MKKIILLAIFAVSIFSLKAQTLDVDGGITMGTDGTYSMLEGRAAGAAIKMGTNSSTWDRNMYLGFNDNNFVFSPVVTLIHLSGNVGIGTTSPDSLLTVNGFIHAKGVTIDLNGPLADFVFNKDYKLMPLNKVADFVKTNSHLPGMPSAKQVAKNGLSMGEMQNKLLQKVEELTLYVIQQQKQIASQQQQIDELKKNQK